MNAKLFFKRNSSIVLTCIGAVGVVGTSVMAVKATPKAMVLLKEAKEEKGEQLSKLEVVRIAGPVYIPSIIMGASTIACILGANALSKRNQAALISAYALLDNSYKEYKDKVAELYGEDANSKVREGIAKDKYDEHTVKDSDKELFYDYYSNRYFESTVEDVQRAEYRINRNLVMRDYSYLNEFYEELGLKPIESGWDLGWTPAMNLDCYRQPWIDFTHEKVTMDDGLECHVIIFQQEPMPNFADY